ncbi:NAD(P)/FAD-dependent oxidoreductase [Paenibacillus sp. 1001270B_150601_E10]|uniref:NAD(P)/FAD-dependent oxidoreductase n=1 Tax=Paenibacillus sp. 1001270B_150601_E10 TaxID=2787079 RepID=UPI001E3930AE|nr:FAD-dependent oxidoreductase [Paenibacillus sp. 1001270B_150601_E10]
MEQVTCIVLGGGFAGIHAMKAIHQAFHEQKDRMELNLILMDKLEAHVRKVLLFQPAASGEPITVPWKQLLPEGVRFVQGAATHIDHERKQLHYQDQNGNEKKLPFDKLVVAVGSMAEKHASDQGGFSLIDTDSARDIRIKWMANLEQAAKTSNSLEKRRLMCAAVAGAGITGVETAAELAHAMKAESLRIGLDPHDVQVHLFNAKARLFQEGPVKVSHKIERTLAACGVTVHHQCKALYEKDGLLNVSSRKSLPVGLTIWTLGLKPNPILLQLSLPLTKDEQVKVDASYRVNGRPNIYSIGDCAHIVDPITGIADGMTCKEAIPQAQRLGSVLYADMTGGTAPQHKNVITSFTIGLGPDRGNVDTQMGA